MANDTTLTIGGNLTTDPWLRVSSLTGNAWVRFSFACTPRRCDQATGRWVDGATRFLRCIAWRDTADRIAETLERGQRVIVTALELVVGEIAPSLRWETSV